MPLCQRPTATCKIRPVHVCGDSPSNLPYVDPLMPPLACGAVAMAEFDGWLTHAQRTVLRLRRTSQWTPPTAALLACETIMPVLTSTTMWSLRASGIRDWSRGHRLYLSLSYAQQSRTAVSKQIIKPRPMREINARWAWGQHGGLDVGSYQRGSIVQSSLCSVFI